jgi:hypothetical protein
MKNSRWFFIGALLLYAVSFVCGFSIGTYLLLGSILLLFLGVSKKFGLCKTWFSIVLSILVWYALVTNVDDYYLFYPFTFFV